MLGAATMHITLVLVIPLCSYRWSEVPGTRAGVQRLGIRSIAAKSTRHLAYAISINKSTPSLKLGILCEHRTQKASAIRFSYGLELRIIVRSAQHVESESEPEIHVNRIQQCFSQWLGKATERHREEGGGGGGGGV